MYTFIEEDDLKRFVKDEFLVNLLLGLSQANLDLEESVALEKVFTYLRGRYDVEAIQNANPKNALVKDWVCTIMVYNFHRRQNNRGIPEHVAEENREAIILLTDIQDGKSNPNLPLLPPKEDGSESLGSNDLRYGSRKSGMSGTFFFGG